MLLPTENPCPLSDSAYRRAVRLETKPCLDPYHKKTEEDPSSKIMMLLSGVKWSFDHLIGSLTPPSKTWNIIAKSILNQTSLNNFIKLIGLIHLKIEFFIFFNV